MCFSKTILENICFVLLMASLQYIEESNQEVLWNLFHMIPNVNSIPVDESQKIFLESLEIIYNTIPSHLSAICKEDLQTLNKQTITLLLQKTKAYQTPIVQTNEAPYYYETPQEKTERAFEEKQKQYEYMNAKPDLPKPSELFQEPGDLEDDIAIQNMDALIAEYQKQRDLDMPVYPNPAEEMDKPSDKPMSITETITSFMKKVENRLDKIEERLANLETI